MNKARAMEIESDNSSWQEFRIPGLEHIQDDEFRMKVRPLLLDFGAIEQLLSDAGIPRERAMQYVEQFASSITRQEFAHAIAERMERIG